MTGNEKPKVGGIVLAAGGSSRLGGPKQLLQFKGKSLLRHAAEAMSASICDPAVVVLGAESERSAKEIEGLAVTVCVNEDWRSGMSSSINAGLAKLIEIEPDLDAVLVSLCDQPLITAEMLDRFVERFRVSDSAVVAASYNGVYGVPALFSRKMLVELSKLEGDKGARNLIRNCSDIATIDLPEATVDIDTHIDAARFGITKSE